MLAVHFPAAYNRHTPFSLRLHPLRHPMPPQTLAGSDPISAAASVKSNPLRKARSCQEVAPCQLLARCRGRAPFCVSPAPATGPAVGAAARRSLSASARPHQARTRACRSVPQACACESRNSRRRPRRAAVGAIPPLSPPVTPMVPQAVLRHSATAQPHRTSPAARQWSLARGAEREGSAAAAHCDRRREPLRGRRAAALKAPIGEGNVGGRG